MEKQKLSQGKMVTDTQKCTHILTETKWPSYFFLAELEGLNLIIWFYYWEKNILGFTDLKQKKKKENFVSFFQTHFKGSKSLNHWSHKAVYTQLKLDTIQLFHLDFLHVESRSPSTHTHVRQINILITVRKHLILCNDKKQKRKKTS